jgi:two-component system, OmpR family, response regulator ChvI
MAMTAQLGSSNALPNFPHNLLHSPRPDSGLAQDSMVFPRICVAFVDDDDIYREAVTMELEHLGFNVSAFPNGDGLFQHLSDRSDTQVIILDWRLKTGLGIDLLPPIRERGINLPIMFLTGLPALAAEYAALDMGAVDFVDKARGTGIIARRLRLIVQSYKAEKVETSDNASEALTPVSSGKLKLLPDIARAYWDGADLDFTLGEFKVVHLLVSRAGDYVSYRSIYDCVHYTGFMAGNGEDGFRTNVRSSIKRIRNKFRQFDDGFCGIENYAAFGYRWIGAVNDG